MYILRLLALVLLLTPFAACEQGPTSPIEPSFGSASDRQDADDETKEKVKLKGSGFVTAGTGLRVVTVDAESVNGVADGQYTVELTGPGLFFTVDVSCLVAERNTAWIAGHISDTNAGGIQIGSVSYFYAIDNGEEKKNRPDVVSSARINDVAGEDEAFCRDRLLLLPELPLEGGDVEIEIEVER